MMVAHPALDLPRQVTSMALRSLFGALTLIATLVPAHAEAQQIKIGIGYGLAFLPFYICEDLKLVEKYAKAAQLDVKVSFPRLNGAAQVRSALASGAIDMGPFGTAPLLAAWDKARGTPQQIFAVSGITSLPLTLLSNQPDEHSIADLKPGERIAVPTLTSPQMQLLEMQSEKIFGHHDRLSSQVVVLSHADAVDALGEGAAKGKDGVTAYFASPPYTELASRDANVHPILTSADVIGGKFSFLVLGATKATLDAQPRLSEAIDKAMDEAARIIHDDPRRAAQIYLTHEPSGTLNAAAMAGVIGDIKDAFGSAVYGVQAMADFMARHGELKMPPKSWKDVVAPALLNSSSS
jgi:NitT/TauT family transport system substrate-binding protein